MSLSVMSTPLQILPQLSLTLLCPVTVTASSLASSPPASGHLRLTFHKLSHGTLSEPLWESCGPLDKGLSVWPAVLGLARASYPQEEACLPHGLEAGHPGAQPGPTCTHSFLVCICGTPVLPPPPSRVCAPWSALQGTHPHPCDPLSVSLSRLPAAS